MSRNKTLNVEYISPSLKMEYIHAMKWLKKKTHIIEWNIDEEKYFSFEIKVSIYKKTTVKHFVTIPLEKLSYNSSKHNL